MGEKERILIIDDDAPTCRSLALILGKKGYETETAGTGRQAIEKAQERFFNIAFVDIGLPDIDGLELISRLKERRPDMDVIMATGYASLETAVRALNEGAAAFVTKPLNMDEVLARVRDILEKQRLVMENRRLLEEMSELAIRDELTGLYNRREMNRLLVEEANRSRRFGRPTTLVMLDIDHFKVVNDAYGHQVGDEVLRWIGQMLRENVRSMDRPARYGGEEFTIILPETPGDEAFVLAERLRQGIAAHPFTLSQDDGPALRIPITISLGMAELPSDADAEEALIEMADQALYEAKGRGRNCTVRYRIPD